MAFIEFTERYTESDGPRSRVVMVNVDRVAKAVFENGPGELTLFLALPGGSEKFSKVVLSGNEAVRAMEVLRQV